MDYAVLALLNRNSEKIHVSDMKQDLLNGTSIARFLPPQRCRDKYPNLKQYSNV
jgi:hypothetical protein